MIFTYEGVSVTLEAPAQYPLSTSVELIQAKEMSATGITHTEDYSVQRGNDTYVFKDMSENDYLILMAFFVNTAEGILNKFELTDDLGVTKTVRFSTSTIAFKKNYYQLWDGSFSVESES